VQTVNMQRAWAQNGSPGRNCFRIKIEEKDGALVCLEGAPGANDCLTDSSGSLQGGCDFLVSATPVSGCIWTVTVSDTCEIVAATSKNGPECHDIDVTGAGSTITINTCGVSGHDISHVELEICCEQPA
jgi:hypothetical protein